MATLPKAKNYILFTDTFAINDMDKEGRKFDRDTANIAQSEEAILPLPIMTQGDQPERPSWREKNSMDRDLSDDYEYIMYGKVYKYDEEKRSKVAVYISFGGLLMALEGDFRHVQNIHVGQNVYMLMKRQF
ncbi:4597_t:CDS:2 [Funneliformis geosporum]|nr:4597_t:CDS:2 [Funneliformis geosporum]